MRGKLRLIALALMRGRGDIALRIAKNVFWGLTHRLCVACGEYKGISTNVVCNRCFIRRIEGFIDAT